MICEYDEEGPTFLRSRSARDASAEEPPYKRTRTSPPAQQAVADLQKQIGDLQNQIKETVPGGLSGVPGIGAFQGDWLAQSSISNAGYPLFADIYSNRRLMDIHN